MKVHVDNLKSFVDFLKLYYEDFKNNYSEEPEKGNNSIYLRILEQPYIKDREEIIKKEIKEGTKEWLFAKMFFENPYYISVSDNEKHLNSKVVSWEGEIFDISLYGLCEFLKRHHKKYLSIRNNCYGWLGKQTIIEMEIQLF